MKITFLCGSVEIGKDGVGDYVRRLAGAVIKQGHSCMIVSLMEKGNERKIEQQQESDGINMSVIRLPFKNGILANCIEAEKSIKLFNPDWISLQFVPFSFHDKGLSLNLAWSIKKLTDNRRLHIMFHELWVGMETTAPFKLRMWGLLQRIVIKGMLRELRPDVINTNTALYVAQLSRLGYKADRLPLFGNIPLVDQTEVKIKETNDLRFVVFGSIHHGAPVNEFAKELNNYAINRKIAAEIIFVGRCGDEQSNWAAVCGAAGLKVQILGEQPIFTISKTLQNADIGISTTPVILAEKSGTVAAMQEHGLPVLCVARAWSVKAFPKNYLPLGVQLFKQEQLAKIINGAEISNVSTLSAASSQLLNSFKSFN